MNRPIMTDRIGTKGFPGIKSNTLILKQELHVKRVSRMLSVQSRAKPSSLKIGNG